MDKIKVLQVGCGGIVNAWMGTAAYEECCEVLGLVDLNQAAAEKLRENRGLPADLPIYTDLSVAIKALKPEAVFDTTVPAAHHVVTTTALKSGCHVLGEKPMAETMDQARDMVATSQTTGKIYAVTQTRRWSNNMWRLLDYLAGDPIGQKHTVYGDFSISAHFGGFREVMDHVLLLDMSIHHFDSVRQILGDVDPQWVQAYEWNPPGSNYRHGANASATFGFTDGSVFVYRGTWTSNGMQTSWDCDWTVHGELGAVSQSNLNGLRAERVVDPDEASAEHGGPLIRSLETLPGVEQAEDKFANGHDAAIRDFYKAVREGGTPMCASEDNIKSLAMVHAAIEAAKTGMRVDITW